MFIHYPQLKPTQIMHKKSHINLCKIPLDKTKKPVKSEVGILNDTLLDFEVDMNVINANCRKIFRKYYESGFDTHGEPF